MKVCCPLYTSGARVSKLSKLTMVMIPKGAMKRHRYYAICLSDKRRHCRCGGSKCRLKPGLGGGDYKSTSTGCEILRSAHPNKPLHSSELHTGDLPLLCEKCKTLFLCRPSYHHHPACLTPEMACKSRDILLTLLWLYAYMALYEPRWLEIVLCY